MLSSKRTVLGGGILAQSRRGSPADGGGGIPQLATLWLVNLPEELDGFCRYCESAPVVHFELLPRIFLIGAFGFAQERVTSIVEHDVDTANLLGGVLEGCNDLLLLGHIDLDEVQSTTRVFGPQLFEDSWFSQRGDYGVTVCESLFSQEETEPGGRSGDYQGQVSTP